MAFEDTSLAGLAQSVVDSPDPLSFDISPQLASSFANLDTPSLSFQMPEVSPPSFDPSSAVRAVGGGETLGPSSPTGLERFASGLGEFGGRVASGLGKEVADSPLKALTGLLGLGATGYGFANQLNVMRQLDRSTRTAQRGQDVAQRGQQTALQAAAPAVEFGKDQLSRAQAGALNPAMEAAIQQWVQKAKADIAARFATMGLGNSTDLEQVQRQIDQEALAMRATMLEQEAQTGLQGVGVGVQAGANVGQGAVGAAQNQQAMLAQLIAAANQQLGRLGGNQA